MFWSGNKLNQNKTQLILNDPQDVKIDCASIVLTIGSEVYVTPSSEDDIKVKKKLTERDSQFIIPKGQFALLITHEIVHVPINALAFISFKAKYKYKGLINVSGFHVDPGWKGTLTFSVYNAGPSDIVMEKGNPFALIWYTDLSSTEEEVDTSKGEVDNASEFYKKDAPPILGISSSKIADMTGDIFSPFKLKNEIQEMKEKYDNQLLDLRKEINVIEGKLLIRTGLLIFLTISLTFMFIRIFKDYLT
ncbi:hypothetical protein NK318_01170 [Acinetobacter junii]|uniref:dCTP deaminase domain-containing protein n=1 Tax=Acinetobacter junii TaxID=40215 RepID=UPI0035F9E60D